MFPARATQSSVKRPLRSPLRTSIASRTSVALPTASASGWLISVISAPVARPLSSPRATHSSARARASPSVFMNAPDPIFTSSRMACAPPASFLLITLDAIRAVLSTVAVTSRSAYIALSAGTRSAVWAHTARPTRSTWSISSPVESSVRMPGIESSLSSVPPVCPSPRPESFTTCIPSSAASGATTRVVPSPTPPVECLSTVGPDRRDRSSRSPESTIAAVRATASSRENPSR